MGKFRQFLTALSARYRSIFSFPGDNFSKYRWTFSTFGVCIGIVEICFRIADMRISSVFYRIICPVQVRIFSFLEDNFTKYQWIRTKLGVYIDNVDI